MTQFCAEKSVVVQSRYKGRVVGRFNLGSEIEYEICIAEREDEAEGTCMRRRSWK